MQRWLIKYYIVFCSSFFSLGGLNGQETSILDQRIDLEYSGDNIPDVLKHLSEIVDSIYFSFNPSIFRDTTLQLYYENTKLRKALNDILGGQEVVYIFVGRNIVIRPWLDGEFSNYQTYILSGRVIDKESGELLLGASLYFPKQEGGVYTNDYGVFSTYLPQGKHQVITRHVGYKTDTSIISVFNNSTQELTLEEEPFTIKPIIKRWTYIENILRRPESGEHRSHYDQPEDIPAFGGEPDLMKKLQVYPGVTQPHEGSSAFLVRGGGFDQNLLLIDDAPVYNAGHFLNFFSTINPLAVKGFNFYKGSMPARYGGRISSILDIKTKEGNDQQFEGNASLGFLTARLSMEGPFVKNQSSWFVSARRSVPDLFLKLANPSKYKNQVFYFTDINSKVNFKWKQNHLFVSLFSGTDKFSLRESDEIKGFNWGNTASTIRWNHFHNKKVFFNSSLSFSIYRFEKDINQDNSLIEQSNLKNFSFQENISHYINSNNALEYGGSISMINSRPGILIEEAIEDIIKPRRGLETALHLSHDIQIDPFIIINYGARLSHFRAMSTGFPFVDYTNDIPNTIREPENAAIASYSNIEPRISVALFSSKLTSLKLAYNKSVQYMYLFTTINGSEPQQAWLTASPNILPQSAILYSLGLNRIMFDGSVLFKSEIYYKHLRNQHGYLDISRLSLNEEIEKYILTGSGRSYGLELLLQKPKGKIQAMASYAFSRSLRQYDEIDNGSSFPFDFDVPHKVELVSNLLINSYWTFKIHWTWKSGFPLTVPAGKYTILGKEIDAAGLKNSFRLPPYHRMDIELERRIKNVKREAYLRLSFYNVYARKNPIYSRLYVENNEAFLEHTRYYTIIPDLSYIFTF
jgi:hypothetical protein